MELLFQCILLNVVVMKAFLSLILCSKSAVSPRLLASVFLDSLMASGAGDKLLMTMKYVPRIGDCMEARN